jgi:hypothetical protein
MTLSTIDLTQRLDQLEHRLPPFPAKSFALGRATVRRTNDVVTSVVADVARRVDTVVTTARTGAKTTTGQAKSAVKRTAKVAETTGKQTVGQAKRQAAETASATRRATGELLDDATATIDPASRPRGVGYEEWTKADLYERAQELDIDGRSTMSKPELVAALRSA